MNNYKQSGEVLDFTATAALSSGDLVLVGTKVGVATVDLAIGEEGSVRVWGVCDVPKLSTDVVTQGAALYFDEGNSWLTLDDNAGANTLAGYAFAAAGNGVTTVLVKLNA